MSIIGYYNKTEPFQALDAWLDGKPREVVQAIAARASLRVLPLVSRKGTSQQTENSTLSLIKTTSNLFENTDKKLSSLHGYIGSHLQWFDQNIFILYPNIISFNAVNKLISEKFSLSSFFSSSISSAASVFSCDESAHRYATAFAIASIATSIIFTDNFSSIAKAIKAATSFVPSISTVVWQAIGADCSKFDKGANAEAVMRFPLWHGPAPEWAIQCWRNLSNDRDVVQTGFAPWLKWYEGIAGLDGGPTRDIFGSELSLKIAMQSNDWWKRGPQAVNADVARWLAEKEGKESELAAEIAEISQNPPQQRPAAYRFAWRGGKLAPLPPDAAQDAADAAVMLDELRRKTAEFAELLAGRNYEPRIARSVELLLAALPEDLVTVNPGLLRSRGRSIENDALFFAASDELPEDVKSHLSDVADSLRDLLVCYPQIREKELAARALDLIGADVDQVLRDLTATRDGAAAAPDVVAVEIVQAFDAMAQAPEDPATFVHSDAGRLWLADRLLVAGNYLEELARGVTTVVYDRLAQTGSKAGDAWREVRPKLVDGAVTGLEGLNKPEIFCGLVGALAGATTNANCLIGILGYPLLKPMIERAIKHLKTLAEKPPDDG